MDLTCLHRERHEWCLVCARQTIAELSAEVERLRLAGSLLEHEVQQILGAALGYPRYADDQEHFPGAVASDGVFVGEHVAVTLAEEAARKMRCMLENARVALAAWGEDANAADPVVAVIVLATAWKAECKRRNGQ